MEGNPMDDLLGVDGLEAEEMIDDALELDEGDLEALAEAAEADPEATEEGGEEGEDEEGDGRGSDTVGCTCSGACGSNYSHSNCTCSGNCGSNYSKG